jgi:hypothetical protein
MHVLLHSLLAKLSAQHEWLRIKCPRDSPQSAPYQARQNFDLLLSQTSLQTMLVSLTVGKVDAGVAVLLTEDKRLVYYCPIPPVHASHSQTPR